jgi:hypothetical protein
LAYGGGQRPTSKLLPPGIEQELESLLKVPSPLRSGKVAHFVSTCPERTKNTDEAHSHPDDLTPIGRTRHDVSSSLEGLPAPLLKSTSQPGFGHECTGPFMMH